MLRSCRVCALALALPAAGCGGSASAPAAGFRPATTARSVAPAAAVADPVDAGATVTVHAARVAKVSHLVLGANMAMWYDVTQSGLAASFQQAGFTAVRWPGGSSSDQYHWQTHTLCAGGYANPNSTFDAFMQDVAVPAHLDVAVTLNYGSNATCNGGGDPSEAAAWVDEANNAKRYGVKTWTVGNESFGSWEYDLHGVPHDSATYATAVASGYYPQIKAKDAGARVGVVVAPGWNPNWDQNVLANAKYDFVEYHFYAQAPGQESDAYLLDRAPQALAAGIEAVRADLRAAHRGDTPIYAGELGSVYANPGKQSTSITQALYAGMALAELMKHGVFRATWWLGYGGCSDSTSGNFSPSLYGWQNFGGYMIFSDGTPEYGCPNATAVPRGTLLPTTRAFQLLAPVALDGEHVLAVSLGGRRTDVRAYSLTHGSGYALVLFNLNQTRTKSVTVTIDGLTAGRGVAVSTYGKAQYDESQQNVWAGPTSSGSGSWSGSFSATLPPWSMNVVTVSP